MVKEKLCDVDDPTQPVVGCELDGIDDGDESVQHHRGLRCLTFLVKVNGHLALLALVGKKWLRFFEQLAKRDLSP